MSDARKADSRLVALQPSLLLLGAVTLLLMLGISLDSLSPSVKLAGVSMLMLLSLFWWVGRQRLVTAAVHAAKPILRPLLALVLLQTVLVIGAPLLRPAFESELQNLALLLFLLFVLGALKTVWGRRTWEDSLILVVIALSIVEFVLIVAWFLQWWRIRSGGALIPPTGYRASGLLLGHPNVLAGFIALALPLLLVRILTAPTGPSRILRSAPFGFLLMILFFTSSRGGWAASAIGLSVSAGLLLFSRFEGLAGALSGAASWLRSRPWWQLALAAIAVAGAAYVAIWQIARTGHAPIGLSRLPVWRAAWEIFLSSPFLGHGPGSFPMLYAATSSYRELDIPHAHNLILQVLDENGLVGLAMLTWLLTALGRALFRGWLYASQPTRRSLAAYFGAGAAILSQNMIDFLFGPPLYSAASFVLLALALDAIESPAATSQPKTSAVGQLVLLSALLPIAMYACLRGAWDYWDGVNLARSGDWETAADALCQAEQEPNEPLYAEACGLARSRVEGFRYSEETRTALSTATNGDPFWGSHWANLAMVDWSNRNSVQAVQEMKLARLAMPTDASLSIMAGYFAETVAGPDQALPYYRQALIDNPWLLRDDFFGKDHSVRIPASPESLTTHLTEDGLLLWQAAQEIDADRPGRALPLIERAEQLKPNNATVYGLRAEFELSSGDLEGAWDSIQLGRFIQANNLQLAVLYAQIAEQRGDFGAAREGLTSAANMILQNTQSQRYYYAAYNRYSLPIDRVPAAFQPAPVPGLLDLLDRAARDPTWTTGAQASQIAAWSEAAAVLDRWR